MFDIGANPDSVEKMTPALETVESVGSRLAPTDAESINLPQDRNTMNADQ
jgi:hypothetical protein